jgi:hypothetical protein
MLGSSRDGRNGHVDNLAVPLDPTGLVIMSTNSKGVITVSKKMILGAVAAITAMGAFYIPAADAHGLRVGYRPYIYITTRDGGCDYYYWKWKRTGSFFWKRKFYHCRGIW